MDKKNNLEHSRMVKHLFCHPAVLSSALHLDNVWMRCMEMQFDPTLDDRADLVFQDKKLPGYRAEPDTTLYVVELKSDFANHEVVGQLKKAVDALTARIRYGHWHYVKGIAIAKRYTDSGLKLLKDEGYSTFLWHESQEGVILGNIDKNGIIRRAKVS
jgi:hypothetical protein